MKRFNIKWIKSFFMALYHSIKIGVCYDNTIRNIFPDQFPDNESINLARIKIKHMQENSLWVPVGDKTVRENHKFSIGCTFKCIDMFSPRLKRLNETIFRMEYKDYYHMWEC